MMSTAHFGCQLVTIHFLYRKGMHVGSVPAHQSNQSSEARQLSLLRALQSPSGVRSHNEEVIHGCLVYVQLVVTHFAMTEGFLCLVPPTPTNTRSNFSKGVSRLVGLRLVLTQPIDIRKQE